MGHRHRARYLDLLRLLSYLESFTDLVGEIEKNDRINYI